MKKRVLLTLLITSGIITSLSACAEKTVPTVSDETVTTEYISTTVPIPDGPVGIVASTDNNYSEDTTAEAVMPAVTDETSSQITSETTSETVMEVKNNKGIETINGITYIDGVLIVNKTYSLPKDYNPGVDATAESAFKKMQSAAASEGLNIYISSGFRSYDYQSGLYERYAQRDGYAAADRYSARPGHSEHQTGLAFDLNSIDDSFADTKEGKWVAENCHKYGFIIRYPKGKEEITGYMYESWHIRYLGVDMATKVYESGKTLEEYFGITSEYDE